MHSNILQTINYYCTSEMDLFKKSKYFLEIIKLSNILDVSVCSSFDKILISNKYPQTLYLGISVVDKQGKTLVVDMLDYEHLSYATDIVKIDRKGRISFRSWSEDEDFIETMEWIIEELKNKITQKLGDNFLP